MRDDKPTTLIQDEKIESLECITFLSRDRGMVEQLRERRRFVARSCRNSIAPSSESRAHFEFDYLEHSTVSDSVTRSAAGATQINSALHYGLGASAWIVIAFLAGKQVPGRPLWFFLLAVLVVALPIVIAGIYTSCVNQLRWLTLLRPGGALHSLSSGRAFRTLFWILLGLVMSTGLVFGFCVSTWREWLALALSIPAFWISLHLIQPVMRKQVKYDYLVLGISIRIAAVASAAVTLALYGLLVWASGETSSFETLERALAAKREALPNQAHSSIVQLGLQLITLKEGVGGHYAAKLDSRLALLLAIVGSAALSLSWAASLACFAIRPAEHRRGFGPLSDAQNPLPLTNARIAAIAAAATFIVFFIFVPAMVKTEGLIQSERITETVKKAEQSLERIDGEYFNSGTIAKIRLEREKVLAVLGAKRELLAVQIDRAFDRMELGVDSYLDWYYSLGAEYMRIGKMLVGDLEGYMAEELKARLMRGDAFADADQALAQLVSGHEQATSDYRRSTEAILNANRVKAGNGTPYTVSDKSMAELLALPTHMEKIDFEKRLASSGAGAGMAAVTIGVVTKNILGKSAFKAAAKALATVAAKKFAGASLGVTGGAWVGLAIGTVVPVVGNVVGATVGGFVGGIAGGVAVDFGLLKLEEAMSREDFRQGLLASLRESRLELKRSLATTR